VKRTTYKEVQIRISADGGKFVPALVQYWRHDKPVFNEALNAGLGTVMPEQLITFGSRLTACDCLLTGHVSMVWRVEYRPPARLDQQDQSRGPIVRSPVVLYYRVQFAPRSPFIGD
jgi:hypothetical protein